MPSKNSASGVINYDPIIQKLNSDLFEGQELSVDVLRLDLLHPEISGNKWFKLKRNLEKAKEKDLGTVITFGGAFSNHIAATAAACKMAGLRSIGIIRGEESAALNSTLNHAKENGMHLHFVDRKTYSQKNDQQFESYLIETFGEHYLIPEGGSNKEGILGCTEILKPEWDHDYILCACGTGTTYAGILLSAKPSQKVIGIGIVRGENKLPGDTEKLIHSFFPEKDLKISGNGELEKELIDSSCIANNYCFSGYAKYDPLLVEFKKDLERKYNIPLDHVYTAKLFYALFDLVGKRKFKSGSRLLIIHSGGLQGNDGFESRYLS